MKLPKKVIDDIENEIAEIRETCTKLEQNQETMLPDHPGKFEVEFDKLIDYLYFRIKRLKKLHNDTKNS